MDFAIVDSDQTFTPATDIGNNIYISLAVVRGTWWFNRSFGMRDTRRLKNTAQNARLVEAYIREALQWLIDTGRAAQIDIATERDLTQDLHRLKAVITVTQSNGRQVTFDKFVEVA